MELDILKNIGLTDGEVGVYEALLEQGEMTAGQLIAQTKLKRGDCYNKIYDLKNRGLVEEFNKAKKKHFRLTHPQAVEDYISRQEQAVAVGKKAITSIMPTILANYNLAYHKPGVQYFEGPDGLKKLMADSLTAKSEILSVVDPLAVDESIPQENKRYVRERLSRGIRKKILVADSDYARKRYANYDDMATEVRFMNCHPLTSRAVVQVYDDKVSFQTFKKEAMMAIIIRDKAIAAMLRELFGFMWAMSGKNL